MIRNKIEYFLFILLFIPIIIKVKLSESWHFEENFIEWYFGTLIGETFQGIEKIMLIR